MEQINYNRRHDIKINSLQTREINLLLSFVWYESINGEVLIGVFITTEYLDLFDFESYFQDNADKVLSGGEISSSDSAPYEGKLYAILVDDPYTNPETGETVTTKKYVFDGIEGIAYFSARYTDEESGMQYWGTGGDDAISDAHTGLHSTDAGDSIEMKGTIYVSTSKGSNVFYYNPVYQTVTGEVYAIIHIFEWTTTRNNFSNQPLSVSSKYRFFVATITVAVATVWQQ